VVKEAAKFMRASLPKSIEVRTAIESDSLVLADPTQIHQVIMNLCINAGHAMKDQTGVLTIALQDVELNEHHADFHPRIKPGRYVRISISDTGVGIAPSIIERIFDPFFTTKVKDEGTGMGLSVVHGIVESCGGTVSVYSLPDHGATFHAYLPVMDIEEMKAVAHPFPIPTGSERILLVDDETKLANAGRQILEQLGYDVVVHTSGIQAVELFCKTPERFDLVITDLTMPGLTGDELAEKVKEIRPDVPVIMITGLSEQVALEKVKSFNIDRIIMKPISTREIATAVRGALDAALDQDRSKTNG
jgi:CheY-like chemotaxis protein